MGKNNILMALAGIAIGMSLVLAPACSSTKAELLAGSTGCSGEIGDHGHATIHGSFYGYYWVTPQTNKNSERCLAKVQVRTNLLYSFVSVISLGFYVPLDEEWWIENAYTD